MLVSDTNVPTGLHTVIVSPRFVRIPPNDRTLPCTHRNGDRKAQGNSSLDSLHHLRFTFYVHFLFSCLFLKRAKVCRCCVRAGLSCHPDHGNTLMDIASYISRSTRSAQARLHSQPRADSVPMGKDIWEENVLPFTDFPGLCQYLLVNRDLNECVKGYLSNLVVRPEEGQGWTGTTCLVGLCALAKHRLVLYRARMEHMSTRLVQLRVPRQAHSDESSCKV